MRTIEKNEYVRIYCYGNSVRLDNVSTIEDGRSHTGDTFLMLRDNDKNIVGRFVGDYGWTVWER